jgi:sugar lactone lactonase YvrE
MSETILPGEIIGTGTLPNCSGIENGYLLKEKDVIELKMEPFGSLKNTVGEKSKVKENIWQTAETKKKRTIFTFGNILYYSIIGILGIMYLIFLFTPVGIQPKYHYQEYSNSFENQTAPIHFILKSTKFHFKNAHGPESIIFDKHGNMITGLSDGTVRRFKFGDENSTEIIFRTGSENNVELEECTSPKTEHRCGRPLGLEYDEENDIIYVADSYLGIMAFDGKNLTKIVKPFEPVIQMAFLNSVRLNKQQKMLYFTDSSSIFPRKNFQDVVLHNGDEGRLFSYNLKDKTLSTVRDKLSFPNGVTFNKDQSVLYFVETNRYTVKKLYISGPSEGVEETIQHNLPCTPDNIISNDNGILWVGCFSPRSVLLDFLRGWPRVTLIFWKLNSFANEKLVPFFASKQGIIIGINETTGSIEHIYRDTVGDIFNRVSEVREKDGYLYLGSVIHDYITRIKKP